MFGAFWLWLAACSLDPDPPRRNGSAAPISSGVTLSGAGTAQELDASVGYGEGSRISDINGKSGDSAAADGRSRAIDSGGAFVESVGDIGGAASAESSSAGAGGSVEHAAAAGSGESGGAAGAAVNDPPATLWFSEYIEGSSSNKALEITALARSVLDGCKVGTYFNGKTELTVVASLSGILEAGQVLTLCTSTLKEKLPAACNQASNLTFKRRRCRHAQL